MTATYNFKTLTHLPMNACVSRLQERAPFSLTKLIKRVLGTPMTAGELRESGLPINFDINDNEPMLSVFDFTRLGKHYLPFRHCVDMIFTNDAYWFMRPSSQFDPTIAYFNNEAKDLTGVANFADSLDDPKFNVIKQYDHIDDTLTTSFENEYHSDVFIEIPVLGGNTAYFFIGKEFFNKKTTMLHDNDVWCKFDTVNALFQNAMKLEEFSGLQCKVMMISSDREWIELTHEDVIGKLNVLKKKEDDKALRDRKRAQAKYASEQYLIDTPF